MMEIEGKLMFTYTRIRDRLSAFDHLDTIYALSLSLIILHAPQSWILWVPSSIGLILMLLDRTFFRSSWIWGTILVCFLIFNIEYWYSIDNHKYLMLYWTGVIFISTNVDQPLKFLRDSATMLIILTFGFACFWKLYSIEFLNGDFMQLQLLFEPRVKYITVFFSQIDIADIEDKERLLRFLDADPNTIQRVGLNKDPMLLPLAYLMSYAGLIAELMVFMTFIPLSFNALCRYKERTLLGFILFTYFLIPVVPFGFTLGVLGYSQLAAKQKNWRVIFLLVILVLQIYSRFSFIDLVRGDFAI